MNPYRDDHDVITTIYAERRGDVTLREIADLLATSETHVSHVLSKLFKVHRIEMLSPHRCDPDRHEELSFKLQDALRRVHPDWTVWPHGGVVYVNHPDRRLQCLFPEEGWQLLSILQTYQAEPSFGTNGQGHV